MTIINLLNNFIKVFGRSAKRNLRFYSVNLACLTIGLSIVAFALLYIQNETTYDSFHSNAKSTYRIAAQRAYGPWFPSLEMSELRNIQNNQYTWVKDITAFSRVPDRYIKVDGKKFPESKVLVIESGDHFFDVFDFKIISGNPDQLTSKTKSVVISESRAKTYFGYENPIGKSIDFDSLSVHVTGVFQDLPTNTHLAFDLILVDDNYFNSKHAAFTYIVTDEDPVFVKAEIMKLSEENSTDDEAMIDVEIQNIEDIHLNSRMTFEVKSGGDKNQLIIFGSIACVILLISCTNFTNLSTAIFSRRRKEMAVRKVLGSKKSSLTIQFLVESIMMAVLSLPLSIIFAVYLLPYFNQFIGIPFTIEHLMNFNFILILIAIATFTGFLGGIYPSIVMPQIEALKLFKNDFKAGFNVSVRKVLIAIQFFLLIGLGAASFVINEQLTYISNFNTGLKKEGVVKIKRAWSLEGSEKIKSFKSKLSSQSFVLGVSQGYVPGDEDYPMTYLPEGFDKPFHDALRNQTDLQFLDLLGIQGNGPFFEEEAHSSTSLLVNETFVKNLGWENPIGKRVDLSPENPDSKLHEIRGVFSDFNFFSLHQDVTPQMIFIRDNRNYVNQNILVKIDLSHTREAFEWIESVWDEYLPDNPIDYAFMDEDIQRAYEKDQQVANSSKLLSLLAALLSVIGLIGITAFLTTLKTKEIGIRKILGASSANLLYRFSVEYLPLVLLATGIATITGYVFLDNWLDNFAYRISINPLVFPAFGLTLMAIVAFTVSFESLKTIRENPVNALRQE